MDGKCSAESAARGEGDTAPAANHLPAELAAQLLERETPLEPEALCDLLGVVGVSVPVEVIRDRWTKGQCLVAEEWASATYLAASDNPVTVPPRPAFLPQPSNASARIYAIADIEGGEMKAAGLASDIERVAVEIGLAGGTPRDPSELSPKTRQRIRTVHVTNPDVIGKMLDGQRQPSSIGCAPAPERFVVMRGDEVPIGCWAEGRCGGKAEAEEHANALNFDPAIQDWNGIDHRRSRVTNIDTYTHGYYVVDTETVAAPEALTNAERELLQTLAEEAAEVVQRCTKMLRFGKRRNPYSGKQNSETLEDEIGDVLAFTEMCDRYDLIAYENVIKARDRKLEALARNEAGRLRYARVEAARNPDDCTAPPRFVLMRVDEIPAGAAAEFWMARVSAEAALREYNKGDAGKGCRFDPESMPRDEHTGYAIVDTNSVPR